MYSTLTQEQLQDSERALLRQKNTIENELKEISKYLDPLNGNPEAIGSIGKTDNYRILLMRTTSFVTPIGFFKVIGPDGVTYSDKTVWAAIAKSPMPLAEILQIDTDVDEVRMLFPPDLKHIYTQVKQYRKKPILKRIFPFS